MTDPFDYPPLDLPTRAEIARLRVASADRDALILWCDAAEAEIARLRGALEAISEYDPPEVMKDGFAYDRMLGAVHDAARAALEGER